MPDPPHPADDRDPAPATAPDRLATLEATVASLAAEVRTRRLTVCDDSGRERIVAEVAGGQAQLRLTFVGPRTPGPNGVPTTTAAVLVFACPAHDDLGPLAGLQVWADGDVVAAVEAWADAPGRWRAALHLAD